MSDLRRRLRDLVRHARRQGWSVEPTASGHLRWVGPRGELAHTASTPSDPRGLLDDVARLRRAGLRLPARYRQGGER